MFEIGFSELVLILLVALVVLGPERLPQAAAKLGRVVGQARSMMRGFMAQLQAETAPLREAADLRNVIQPELDSLKKDLNETAASAQPSTPRDDAH